MGQYKFILPNKRGSEIYLTVIPQVISLGFYRVKITSEHKHATKLFAFSPEHTYNNISLSHAMELQEDYNFKIELIIDDKPNAYMWLRSIKYGSLGGKEKNELDIVCVIS